MDGGRQWGTNEGDEDNQSVGNNNKPVNQCITQHLGPYIDSEDRQTNKKSIVYHPCDQNKHRHVSIWQSALKKGG